MDAAQALVADEVKKGTPDVSKAQDAFERQNQVKKQAASAKAREALAERQNTTDARRMASFDSSPEPSQRASGVACGSTDDPRAAGAAFQATPNAAPEVPKEDSADLNEKLRFQNGIAAVAVVPSHHQCGVSHDFTAVVPQFASQQWH